LGFATVHVFAFFCRAFWALRTPNRKGRRSKTKIIKEREREREREERERERERSGVRILAMLCSNPNNALVNLQIIEAEGESLRVE
jgi:hypothetical protein